MDNRYGTPITDATQATELKKGMLLEVLTPDNKLIFVGRVEKINKDSIVIYDDGGVRLPYIEYNSLVRLRGFSDFQMFTMEGLISGNTDNIWRVEELYALQKEERRQNFRQNAAIDIQVMCVNSIFGEAKPGDEKKAGTFNGRILDISSTGVRVRTEGVYEAGDWLFLIDIRISPKDPALTVTCIIRRVIVSAPGANEYGCEFYGLTTREMDDITRMVLTLQRGMLHSRRSSLN